MSSSDDSNKTVSDDDFKAMNFNEFEQYLAPEVSEVKESISKMEPGFNPLYQGEAQTEELDEFTVLYKKGEAAVS